MSLLILGKYVWWIYFLYLLDLVDVTLKGFTMIKLLIFAAQLCFVVISSMMAYLRQLNRELSIAVRLYRLRRVGYRMFIYRTAVFIRRHHCQVNSYQRMDRDFLSSLFFLILVTQIPLNAYMMAKLFHTTQWEILMIVLLVVVAQFVTFLIVLGLLSETSRLLHVPGKHFPTVIRLIRSNNLWFKWKTLAYYERVHSINKLAFTAGPIGKITYSTLFEVRPRRRGVFSSPLLTFSFLVHACIRSFAAVYNEAFPVKRPWQSKVIWN